MKLDKVIYCNDCPVSQDFEIRKNVTYAFYKYINKNDVMILKALCESCAKLRTARSVKIIYYHASVHIELGHSIDYDEGINPFCNDCIEVLN